MPIQVTMPRLSDTMEQGTVVSWNVKEGDEVSAGDVLGDIETDKATMELQNFDDGVVAAIMLSEGATVDVGQTILVLAEDGEDVAQVKKDAEAGNLSAGTTPEPAAASAEVAAATASPPSSNGEAHAENGSASIGTPGSVPGADGGRIFATPVARKIADEQGVDLNALQGTGPSGRITKADVEAAAGGGAPAAASGAPIPAAPVAAASEAAPGSFLRQANVTLSNMRGTIAKRLVESKTTIPHYQVTVAVDMDPLIELRSQLNEQLKVHNVKLSVNDFLVRACGLAMHEHPFVNASWNPDGKSITVHEGVNVGVAIALPVDQVALSGGGLVVATIRNADRMGLRGISAETKRLAKKARDKGLTIDEMSDATFTISNLGMYGVEHFTAIINPPNSAILAVGGAVKKPVVRVDDEGNDFITVGHEMQMTMSSDHRVIDGAMAAEFLTTVKRYIEAPASILV